MWDQAQLLPPAVASARMIADPSALLPVSLFGDHHLASGKRTGRVAVTLEGTESPG